jgi:hypothetical protein
MRVLILLIAIAVVLWALFDAIQTDSRDMRRLNKPLWVLIILLLPFGAFLWFVFGRPRVASGAAGAGNRSAHPARQQREQVSRPAPDDDPEFLAHLSAQAEQQRKLRLLENQAEADERKAKDDPRDGDGPEGDGPRPTP